MNVPSNSRFIVAAAGFAGSAAGGMAQMSAPPLQRHTASSAGNGGAVIIPTTGCGKSCSAAKGPLADRMPLEDPLGHCIASDAAGLTDLLHCNLDLEVIPETTTITGNNTFTIMSRVDGLTTFTFRLRSQFTIVAAMVNGFTPVSVTTPTATTRIATLDRPYNTGEIFTLTVSYAGVPVSLGFGSIEFASQNGEPLIYTLSEPYYSYTWWPCKDGDDQSAGDNSDKFTAEVAVTAPASMKSVSNGRLWGIDKLPGERARYRWATQEQTATYLIFFSTTNYNQWLRIYAYPGGVMPVEFSIFPAYDTPANRAAWEECLPMLAAFRTVFGEYPFVGEKYGIYNFNFGGGQEHQTYSGQGGFGESLTAHELAHQWWGDNVTCKTWHDIWLNEGFATYAEALWEERRPGSSGVPALLAAMAARRPSSFAGTVYRTDVSSVSSIFNFDTTYLKAGWVLHQLRHIVGDANFFETLAAYRAAYDGSAVVTGDFVTVASTVYGENLSWFFDEWVYGPGAPWYGAIWQNVSIAGRPYLRLRLTQRQLIAYPLFSMPVDIRVNFAGGNQTVVVWSDAAQDDFLIPLPFPATDVVVDENRWILTLIDSTTTPSSFFIPPKIVAASPAPNATVPVAAASAVTISFSDAVSNPSGAFALTGPFGPVPVVTVWNALTVTLEPASPLQPGEYTVTIRDTITAHDLALDGEIRSPHTTSDFPSGDGVAGGDAVWSFTVALNACYANCDSSTAAPVLNVNDFVCFLNGFAAGSSSANCDHSTTLPILNSADFTCFLHHYTAGCP